MRETLSTFCTPIGDVKSRTERKEDDRRIRVTPDLLFETNGFRFYVDCHYRTSMPYAYVEQDYPGVYRLNERCYEKLEHPVFVAYGIGGGPYHPDWMVFEPKENLHTRRMTKSRFLKLDRKLPTLSYYNVIYQYRMRQAGFGDARTWDTGRKEKAPPEASFRPIAPKGPHHRAFHLRCVSCVHAAPSYMRSGLQEARAIRMKRNVDNIEDRRKALTTIEY